jgi:prepilin-type processing-associated H-X9-DG protein/prepilin-type N-terminal cleavage/methylation domain-containing protein
MKMQLQANAQFGSSIVPKQRLHQVRVLRRSNNAMTLIELLVVIAIVSTLTALVLPGLGRSKKLVQAAVCKGNLRQLGLGLQTFLSDNHYYPENRFQTKPLSPPNTDRLWLGKLVREGLNSARPSTNFQRFGVWRCPSAQWSAAMLVGNADLSTFCDYGYNDDKFSGSGWTDSTNKFGLEGHYSPAANMESVPFKPISESEVVVPSEMFAIGDCFEANGLLMRKSIEAFESSGNVRTRHQRKANVVFCDGHVGSPTLKLLFEENGDAALAHWNRDNHPRQN